MRIAFTYFADGKRNSKSGTVHEADALAFLERLTKPRETSDKFSVPAFALATFDGSRSLVSLKSACALGFDVDGVADLADLFAGFGRHLSIVYTTWSSTAEKPRARAFMVLSRPVTLTEYRTLTDACITQLESAGHKVDRAACRDASRAWPLPAIPKKGEHFDSRVGTGAPLDVDHILSILPRTEPEPPPRPIYNSTAEPRVIDRARAYLTKCEPSISGSGGHKAAFLVAQKLVRGFGLDEATAWELLIEDFNPRCVPPWLPRELLHKVKQAGRVGQFPEGALRDAPRRIA